MLTNILQGLFNFIIQFFGNLGQLITNFFIMPMLIALTPLLPNISEYYGQFLLFLGNYVFKAIAFMKEVFLNATGYPRPLFNAVVLFFFARISLMFFIRFKKFVLNVLIFIRGGRGNF